MRHPLESSEIKTLRQILRNQDCLDPGDFLFLPFDEVWKLETRCAVLHESDVDGLPQAAKDHGLGYAMGISAVQDVVWNAKAQDQSVTDSQLLEAFLFYYDHDAFIVFR
jgi:hypothetical protein